jgi:hypothetical protein
MQVNKYVLLKDYPDTPSPSISAGFTAFKFKIAPHKQKSIVKFFWVGR